MTTRDASENDAPDGGTTELARSLELAWRHYGESRYDEACATLEAALQRDPRDFEVQYALALALKKRGDAPRAAATFRGAIDSLDGQDLDTTRRRMLRRLAVGHLNMLDHGRWDLEPETWERT